MEFTIKCSSTNTLGDLREILKRNEDFPEHFDLMLKNGTKKPKKLGSSFDDMKIDNLKINDESTIIVTERRESSKRNRPKKTPPNMINSQRMKIAGGNDENEEISKSQAKGTPRINIGQPLNRINLNNKRICGNEESGVDVETPRPNTAKKHKRSKSTTPRTAPRFNESDISVNIPEASTKRSEYIQSSQDGIIEDLTKSHRSYTEVTEKSLSQESNAEVIEDEEEPENIVCTPDQNGEENEEEVGLSDEEEESQIGASETETPQTGATYDELDWNEGNLRVLRVKNKPTRFVFVDEENKPLCENSQLHYLGEAAYKFREVMARQEEQIELKDREIKCFEEEIKCLKERLKKKNRRSMAITELQRSGLFQIKSKTKYEEYNTRIQQEEGFKEKVEAFLNNENIATKPYDQITRLFGITNEDMFLCLWTEISKDPLMKLFEDRWNPVLFDNQLAPQYNVMTQFEEWQKDVQDKLRQNNRSYKSATKKLETDMKNANCDPEKIERTIQQRRDTWEENNSRVDKIVKTKKGKKAKKILDENQ